MALVQDGHDGDVVLRCPVSPVAEDALCSFARDQVDDQRREHAEGKSPMSA
jgi:hypothetical protein